MKISLVIPVYNEANHLPEFLEKIDKLLLPIEKELVIIDDCSKDNSYSIISNFAFQTPVVIYKQEKNLGKGAAIRKGFDLSTGSFIAVQDADFEYDMEEIPKLLQPLIDQKADIVYGSRFKKGVNQVHRTFHYLVNRILTAALFHIIYFNKFQSNKKCFKDTLPEKYIPQGKQWL